MRLGFSLGKHGHRGLKITEGSVLQKKKPLSMKWNKKFFAGGCLNGLPSKKAFFCFVLIFVFAVSLQSALAETAKEQFTKGIKYINLADYLSSKKAPIVYFDFNRDDIKPSCYALLNEVARY